MKHFLFSLFLLVSSGLWAHKLYVNENFDHWSYDAVKAEVDKGNVAAMCHLAEAMAYGKNASTLHLKKNLKKRLEYLNTCADFGYPYALKALSLTYGSGKLGPKVDWAKSEAYKKKAYEAFKIYADKGDARAMAELSGYYDKEHLFSKVYWLALSVQQGYEQGANLMRQLFSFNIYTPKNDKVAQMWNARYSLLANKKTADLMHDEQQLARMTYSRVAVIPSSDEARIQVEGKRLFDLYCGNVTAQTQASVSKRIVSRRNNSTRKPSLKTPVRANATVTPKRKPTPKHPSNTAITIANGSLPKSGEYYFQRQSDGSVASARFFMDDGDLCLSVTSNSSDFRSLIYVYKGMVNGKHKFVGFLKVLNTRLGVSGMSGVAVSVRTGGYHKQLNNMDCIFLLPKLTQLQAIQGNYTRRISKEMFYRIFTKSIQNGQNNQTTPSGTIPRAPKIEYQKRDNRLYVDCRICGGTGRCRTCNGTGDRGDTHNWDDSQVFWKCTSCGGSGRCDACRGTGKIYRW